MNRNTDIKIYYRKKKNFMFDYIILKRNESVFKLRIL